MLSAQSGLSADRRSEFKPSDFKDSQASIAIKDDGPGIPPEELNNIWDRFYKVDKSRSRRGNGTGLGLSIVKQIVEKNGGEVTADSRLGLGSIFTVYLPLVE